MSGFAKDVWKNGFTLRKMRSSSLAINAKSVLFPIDRVVRVSEMQATERVDQTGSEQLTRQLMFFLEMVGVSMRHRGGYCLSGEFQAGRLVKDDDKYVHAWNKGLAKK